MRRIIYLLLTFILILGIGYAIKRYAELKQPPKLSISSPTDGLVINKAEVEVSGEASVNSTIKISVLFEGREINVVHTKADSKGLYEEGVELIDKGMLLATKKREIVDGSYIVEVTAYNLTDMDIKTSERRRVVLDITPPILIVTQPKDKSKAEMDRTEVVGTTDPGAKVEIRIHEMTEIARVRSDGGFSHPVSLRQGDNEITIISTDPAGNSVSEKVTVLLPVGVEERESQIAKKIIDSVKDYIDLLQKKGVVIKPQVIERLKEARDSFDKGEYHIAKRYAKEAEDSARSIDNLFKDAKGMMKDARASMDKIPDKDLEKARNWLKEAESNLRDGEYELAKRYAKKTLALIPPPSKPERDLPPKLEIASPRLPEKTTNERMFEIRGVVSDDMGIKRVEIDGKEITLRPDGGFSSIVSLKEGKNRIAIVVTDTANQTESRIVTIIMDSISPCIEDLEPKRKVFTKEGRVAISGRAADKGTGVSEVLVKKNAVRFSQDGYFATTLADLKEGLNIIPITVTDGAGNRIEERVEVFVDTTPPKLEITHPAKEWKIQEEEITVAGRVTDAGGLDKLELEVDGKIYEVKVIRYDGTFEKAIPLKTIKRYPIVCRATDLVGNQISSLLPGERISLDSPPVITISSPPKDKRTNKEEMTIEGTVSDDIGIKRLEVNGREIALLPDGRFSSLVSLREGKNEVTIAATDTGGNTEREIVTIFRDSRPPQLKITEPTEGLETQEKEVLVVGRATDESGIDKLELEVDGKIFRVEIRDESFSGRVSLESIGDHQIICRATDTLGNSTDPVIRTVKRVSAPIASVPTPPTISLTPPPPSGPWKDVLVHLYETKDYDKAIGELNKLEKIDNNAFVSLYKGLAYYQKARAKRDVVYGKEAIQGYNEAIHYLKDAYAKRQEFSRMRIEGVSFYGPEKNIHDIRFYLAVSSYYIYAYKSALGEPKEGLVRYKNIAKDRFKSYFDYFPFGKDGRVTIPDNYKGIYKTEDFEPYWKAASEIYDQLKR